MAISGMTDMHPKRFWTSIRRISSSQNPLFDCGKSEHLKSLGMETPLSVLAICLSAQGKPDLKLPWQTLANGLGEIAEDGLEARYSDGSGNREGHSFRVRPFLGSPMSAAMTSSPIVIAVDSSRMTEVPL